MAILQFAKLTWPIAWRNFRILDTSLDFIELCYVYILPPAKCVMSAHFFPWTKQSSKNYKHAKWFLTTPVHILQHPSFRKTKVVKTIPSWILFNQIDTCMYHVVCTVIIALVSTRNNRFIYHLSRRFGRLHLEIFFHKNQWKDEFRVWSILFGGKIKLNATIRHLQNELISRAKNKIIVEKSLKPLKSRQIATS